MRKMGVTMQPKNQTEKTAKKIRETLLKNGYDVIEVRNQQYFIPLNQDQVAVFETKRAK
jgi:N-acetylmuramoyl-L-alanine amidase